MGIGFYNKSVEFRFASDDLAKLWSDFRHDGGFGQAVQRAFRNRVQVVQAAPDERTFYQLRSLRFERLKGKRAHQYSMRLNDQWRLILEFEGEGKSKVVVIIGIEDYH